MSATVVVRRVAATPARPAAEAWRLIVDLIAPAGSAARRELDAVASVGMSLVAAEAMRTAPIVVGGVGPRLRVYCLYDDEAILGEGISEDGLTWCPTDGDWAMSLPCPKEDLGWVQTALARASTRVTARDQAEPVPTETNDATEKAATDDRGDRLDLEAFLRR